MFPHSGPEDTVILGNPFWAPREPGKTKFDPFKLHHDAIGYQTENRRGKPVIRFMRFDRNHMRFVGDHKTVGRVEWSAKFPVVHGKVRFDRPDDRFGEPLGPDATRHSLPFPVDKFCVCRLA